MSHPSHRTNKNSAYHLSIDVNTSNQSNKRMRSRGQSDTSSWHGRPSTQTHQSNICRKESAIRQKRPDTQVTYHPYTSIKHLSTGAEINRVGLSPAHVPINQTSNKRMNTRRVYCVRRVGEIRAYTHQSNINGTRIIIMRRRANNTTIKKISATLKLISHTNYPWL